MTPLVAYALLFVAVGVGFIFVHLLAGYFIRPKKPDAEKGTIYECGEPTIGSAWIQFDLRFYVVALLFVIFDVEVAFFFPWAEVFGKANAVANAPRPVDADSYRDYARKVLDLAPPALVRLPDVGEASDYQDYWLKVLAEADKHPEIETQHVRDQVRYGYLRRIGPEEEEKEGEALLSDREFRNTREAASTLAWLALGEIIVFFGVLLVGFAYLWRRGDLNWVRSTAAEYPPATKAAPVLTAVRPPGLVTAG